MNTGVYGIAGLVPDKTKNNGAIDSEQEVYDLLSGMPEGEKLAQILSRFTLSVEVTDIKALSDRLCEALRPGDIVVKVDGTGKHAYLVSYKGTGGLCMTYSDCENVETVAYNKTEDGWAWDSTDITHIGNNG